jgi:NAD(P)H-nitrite reductase large subunit
MTEKELEDINREVESTEGCGWCKEQTKKLLEEIKKLKSENNRLKFDKKLKELLND